MDIPFGREQTQVTKGRPYPAYVARAQRMITDLHVAAYRLSRGRLGKAIGRMPMLLLTTWGRKSGKLRTAPLLYIRDGDDLVLVASNGGAVRSPTWWYNLRDRPDALVQIGARRLIVRARQATPAEKQRLWPLLLEVYPGYADYQARTDRDIPLVLLRPTETP